MRRRGGGARPWTGRARVRRGGNGKTALLRQFRDELPRRVTRLWGTCDALLHAPAARAAAGARGGVGRRTEGANRRRGQAVRRRHRAGRVAARDRAGGADRRGPPPGGRGDARRRPRPRPSGHGCGTAPRALLSRTSFIAITRCGSCSASCPPATPVTRLELGRAVPGNRRRAGRPVGARSRRAVRAHGRKSVLRHRSPGCRERARSGRRSATRCTRESHGSRRMPERCSTPWR